MKAPHGKTFLILIAAGLALGALAAVAYNIARAEPVQIPLCPTDSNARHIACLAQKIADAEERVEKTKSYLQIARERLPYVSGEERAELEKAITEGAQALRDDLEGIYRGYVLIRSFNEEALRQYEPLPRPYGKPPRISSF